MPNPKLLTSNLEPLMPDPEFLKPNPEFPMHNLMFLTPNLLILSLSYPMENIKKKALQKSKKREIKNYLKLI